MFEGYDTDKDSWHSYGKTYERLLGERRGTVEGVFEIGIDKGGSLEAFRDYFPKALVVGFDIDPGTMVHGEERITTFTGNARDHDALSKAARSRWGYDLIVDDGSHLPVDQYAAIRVLWPFLRVGGFYSIEDLDINRNMIDILMTCYIIVHRNAEIHLHPGHQRNGDLLILEKTDGNEH